MTRQRAATVVVGGLLFCGSLAVAQPVASADPERPVEFVIGDARITGSSGLATDPVNRVYWTMNDAGDPGRIYALNAAGKTVGTLRYDAAPTDTESIAYSNGRLYLGDTGGNREKRTVITVYEFTRPRPDNSEQSFRTLRFAYPDGPHDTEAMLVDGNGRFTFVTKGAESGEIFAGPAELSTSEPNSLTRVGEAPQYITDGTVLSDGRMILRSYVAVFRLDPRSYRIVAAAGTPSLKQSESVTTPLSGGGLLIGTEGANSEVLRVPIPKQLGTIPTINATASRPSTPVPAPSESATPRPQTPSSGSEQLYVYAVGGMIVVAGLAAMFLRLRRRGTSR